LVRFSGSAANLRQTIAASSIVPPGNWWEIFSICAAPQIPAGHRDAAGAQPDQDVTTAEPHVLSTGRCVEWGCGTEAKACIVKDDGTRGRDRRGKLSISIAGSIADGSRTAN
jgi:hypothetical protein